MSRPIMLLSVLSPRPSARNSAIAARNDRCTWVVGGQSCGMRSVLLRSRARRTLFPAAEGGVQGEVAACGLGGVDGGVDGRGPGAPRTMTNGGGQHPVAAVAGQWQGDHRRGAGGVPA